MTVFLLSVKESYSQVSQWKTDKYNRPNPLYLEITSKKDVTDYKIFEYIRGPLFEIVTMVHSMTSESEYFDQFQYT